jgi:hypothetical protein
MKPRFKINISKNKSLTYMLPLLHSKVNFDLFQFLENTYVSFADGDELFCVMYNWSSNQQFLKYEGRLMEDPLYVGHADFGEHVVYKFKLTLEMKKAREKFVKGEYKDYTDKQKLEILDYIKSRGFSNSKRISDILDKGVPDVVSAPPNHEDEVVENHIDILTVKLDNPWTN